MRTIIAVAAAVAFAAIGTGAWWLLTPSSPPSHIEGAGEGTGRILYYRDSSGAPNFSPTPKKDAQGRDYIAVRAIEQASGASPAQSERKILYYRNPMGLPDTSPIPKKDNMGMDYIPVYAEEGPSQASSSGSVRISLDRVQRLGVRTEKVVRKPFAQTLRLAGTVVADESKQRLVSMKFSGSIANLRVARSA